MATPAPASASAAPLPKSIGDGRYVFERKLGSGSMGEVYVARDTLFDRNAAIKVLLWNRQSAEMRERFKLEAKTMAKLAGARNICQVTDLRIEGDQIYVIMELIRGKTLVDYMCDLPLGNAKTLKVPTFDAVRFMTGLLTGLAAAHAIGVVHRDLKSENLMITEEGVLKILDFGIAQHADVHLTRTAMQMGNFACSAPEQLEDAKNVDHRADLYAAGVIFYTMLTGDGMTQCLYSTMLSEPERLAGIPAFKEFLLTACAKDPDQRYQDAAAMLAGLEAAMREYLSMTSADHVSEEAPLPVVPPAVQPADDPAQPERPLAQVLHITRPPAFNADGLRHADRSAGTVYMPATTADPILEQPATSVASEPEVVAETPAVDVSLPPAVETDPVVAISPPPSIPPYTASVPETTGEEPLRDIFEDDVVEPPRKRPVAVIVGVVAVIAVIAAAWFAWPQSESTPPMAQEGVSEVPPPVTEEAPKLTSAVVAPAEPVPAQEEVVVTTPELTLPAPVAEVAKPEAKKPKQTKADKVEVATTPPVAKGPVHTGECKPDSGMIACTASVTPAQPGATVTMRYRPGKSGRWLKERMTVSGSGTYAKAIKVTEAMAETGIVQVYIDLRSDDLTEPLYASGRTDQNPFEVTP